MSKENMVVLTLTWPVHILYEQTALKMSDTRRIKAKLEHTKQLVAEMHEQKRRKAEERKKKEVNIICFLSSSFLHSNLF